MSHKLGPFIRVEKTITDTEGYELKRCEQGEPCSVSFVFLHFDNANLSPGARVEIPLGYDTDVFTNNSGGDFWSRPIDSLILPLNIRITGGTGTVRLFEYGRAEPSETPNEVPGTGWGSKSNPDVFLHDNQYVEPIYETRVKCGSTFDWQNAACEIGPPVNNPNPAINIVQQIPELVKNRVAAAVGLIVVKDTHHIPPRVSSCSGTLIASDLFLTARHCLNDFEGESVRSASVTFDYMTACDGSRPLGHITRFFKVIGEVRAGTAPTGGNNPPIDLDWVILRLDTAPGELPQPLQMRETNLLNGELIFSMHHPNGAVKKAEARVYDPNQLLAFDYAGGSSGSAVFDIEGKLVRGPLSVGDPCAPWFAAIASIRAALTNPSPPPKPLDVMLVFDRSGSMDTLAPPIGRTKLEEAKDAASLFIQLVREGLGDRLGLVTFSSSATANTPPDAVASVKSILVGPAPFTTGEVGAVISGGSTSIGSGVDAALSAIGSNSTNDRAILLFTDGLQNTNPMIEDIEGSLGATHVSVIGFGSDADLDGALLGRIAREHGGQFTRALDGLALRKFFGLCFGNIFETGALNDPDFILPANQSVSEPHMFSVCNEECITLVFGWDNPSTPLQAHITTPKDNPINEHEIEVVRGRTWVFSRVPLPHNGERDGTWQFTVERIQLGTEPKPQVRYFFLAISSGGPKLLYLGGPAHVYTGDNVDPLVGLHFRNGTTLHADVELTLEVPDISIGKLVNDFGLRPPSVSGDSVDAFHTTLQAIAHQSGGTLPVPTTTLNFPLFDDSSHQDGAMEPDGIYNNRLVEITKTEGTYHFKAIAKYGMGECTGTRETSWSIHVEIGIDPECTTVTLEHVEGPSYNRHGTLVITPRDKYCNPLGPGRANVFSVSPISNVNIIGINDMWDGRYYMNIVWDQSVLQVPGVLLKQPNRKPVLLMPPMADATKTVGIESRKAADNLLGSLGLIGSKVRNVRLKSINLDLDLNDQKQELKDYERDDKDKNDQSME